jgi:hypothetical protein
MLVVGGGLLVFLGQSSKKATPPETSLAQSTILPAVSTIQPVATAFIAIPEPSAVEEPVASAAPPPVETAAKQQVKTTTAKPAGSTKKSHRDLGY